MAPPKMSGQPMLGGGSLHGGAQAVAQQPFTTMWPSYYATAGGNDVAAANGGGQPAGAQPGDSSQLDDEAAVQRDREQRMLKRKQANRESAKRSKLKRQQAERELQEHARRVDEERETLTVQLASAQQRYTDAQAKHLDLRRKIQGYLPDAVDGGGPCGPGQRADGDGRVQGY